MTEYTAADFKNAKYAARHRDGRTATRREQLGGWITSHGLRQNDQEMAGNGWVPAQEDPRTLTEDLVAAVVRAVEAEKERDEARKFATAEHVRTVKAEQERDECRAMHSEQMKTIARLQESPRPLTADDITDAEQYQEALRQAGRGKADHMDRLTVWLTGSEWARKRLAPSRPEGAEELEALIDRASLVGEGADNESLADYLAPRLLDPTVKDVN